MSDLMTQNQNYNRQVALRTTYYDQAYLTFNVGKQWYAVAVLSVFEVANLVAISEVPDMPKAILGVVNIRGKVVPVLDLRIRFNLGNHSLELTTPIIFLTHGADNIYGIIVDDIDDVINLAPDMINQTSLKQRASHIQGLVDYDGRLIMVLDTVQLITSSLADEDLDAVMNTPSNSSSEGNQ